jgi:hypothetical protein
MYENAAMLALFLLIYSAIAGRVERSLISGPIVFTAVGFILGARMYSASYASTSTARGCAFWQN